MTEGGISRGKQLKCLVCLDNCLSTGSEKKIIAEQENNKEIRGECNTETDQLLAAFFLKKFLEIPEDICSRLLQEHGNPTMWVNCCQSCSIFVSKSRNIYSRIQILENVYNKMQNEIKYAITKSVKSQEQFGRRSFKQAEEIVRSYIAHGYNPEDLSTDPMTVVKTEMYPEESSYFEDLENGHIDSVIKEKQIEGPQIDGVVLASHKPTFNSNDINHSELIIKTGVESPNLLNAQQKVTKSLVSEGSDGKKTKKRAAKKKKSVKPKPSKRNEKAEKTVPSPKKKTTNASKNPENTEYFSCKYCNSKFKVLESLKFHEQIHKGGNPQECHICGKKFSRISILNHHLKKHSGETPHSCDLCEKKFVQLWELKSHKKSHSGLTYTCNICHTSFSNARHMKSHYASLHGAEKLFQCEICGKKFAYAKSLRIHKVIHVEVKSHFCDLCENSYCKAIELKEHIEKVHAKVSVMPHLCQYCGKGFATEKGWKEHLEIHVAEKHNSCDICGRMFVKPFDLAVHIRIHTGEKPHACKICDNRFSSLQGLKSHLKLHTTEKPFTCEFCGKCFRHKLTLTTHLSSHTGEKPYTCKICNKSFSRHNTLSNHVKTHNPEEMSFICDICGRRFLLKKYLRVHLKVHDKNSETLPKDCM